MNQVETGIPKPLPLLEGLAGEFYGYCKNGELRFQRCRDCRSWRHVPREMCAGCGSWEWEWERSSGRGRVFTWTVVVRALHPAFQEACPYAPVVIEMEEGVRILSQVTDCPPDQLEIDMAVEVVFEDANEDVTLPKFRRGTS
ncbi:MAG: OB-fold domain-containing protein [Deltaproteobacteria bacterium]|nr:OB-fold domain-containing protein [Deltaproteobacteria bacterium]MBW2392689.1 OB-fold domain-containing protein [Deltaproteobacteria bacterium]